MFRNVNSTAEFTIDRLKCDGMTLMEMLTSHNPPAEKQSYWLELATKLS